MQLLKNIVVLNRLKYPIYCDIRIGNSIKEMPIIIISHGFECFKDWAFMPWISDQISESGTIAITFNFTHNGIGSRDNYPYYIDDFSKATVSGMINDLEDLINSIENHEFPNDLIYEHWNGEIILAGFSRGGAISIIYQSIHQKASKLVLWAAPNKLIRNSEKQIRKWIEDGEFTYNHLATGQSMMIRSNYILDLLNNRFEFDPHIQIERINCPILSIHGIADMTVRLSESKSLLEKTKAPKQFVIIDKCGHSFGCNHPMHEPTVAIRQLSSETIGFLQSSTY